MTPATRLPVQVIDLFSGCGGLSYGFARARLPRLRYEVIGAIDIDPYACATYERMIGVRPLQGDVTSLLSEASLRAAKRTWGYRARAPLLLIGGAPCQGFSAHRKKDPRLDDRNALLGTFGEIAVRLAADVVVMENVPEILDYKHWDAFDAWRRPLIEAGYTVRTQIYNLAEFGVPQERFRVIAVAARDWPYFAMPAPQRRPADFKTVRQAIAHLPPLKAGQRDRLDPMHVTSNHRPSTVDLIKLIPPDGGSRRALPASMRRNCWIGVDGFRDVYGRLHWDKPSVAITARCRTPSCGRFVHPEQHRGLSVREAALLQGFPPNYIFEGPFDDLFKQVGNAVSPVVSRAIARYLAAEWFADHTDPARLSDTHRDVEAPLLKSFASSIAGIKRRALRPSQLLRAS